jgi:hypothetical protein
MSVLLKILGGLGRFAVAGILLFGTFILNIIGMLICLIEHY